MADLRDADAVEVDTEPSQGIDQSNSGRNGFNAIRIVKIFRTDVIADIQGKPALVLAAILCHGQPFVVGFPA
ncbi:hypothetical protein [Streptomyces sp. cmx-18-6]|uniref:hypothetical protein n=1 Tax=Streptomyces sp. cmx-18-6 TaxID=2790930 RepID=UPI00397EE300